jgi:hypothetical protein
MSLLQKVHSQFFKNNSTSKPPITEKNLNFSWNENCELAFEELKKHLISSPVLAHPDYSKPFLVDTDASGEGLGAVLAQVIDGKEQVISYASRSLTKSEKRYCVTRKELLAVIFAVKQFRHFLYGHKFTIRTDHSALKMVACK